MSEYNISDHIAIIGIGCRFPGAADKNAFWKNLKTGADVLAEYTDEELLANGVSPATLSDPDYVKFGYPINDIESFDAEFFGYSAAEALRMDPQQRLFLQCAWSALEDGGEAGERTARTGVFASAKMSSYLDTQVDPDTIGTSAAFGTLIGNDKDYIATRTSFKLGLTGPSITVQSACSSSLAAVHMAVQSLLAGECDKAIAGGASITIPQRIGYTYEEGMICSPDAKCRAFDKNAQGICAGNGVGVVLLKPLEDALRDKNNIYAVIRGSAMNNDGADKAGFTAPSVSGQSDVILDALSLAEVSARDIGYLEAHGTGTSLGDPIEIQALTTAYRKYTQDCGYCAIASVKSNVGHLDTAAGICSLIKTSMALSHGEMPPSLHFIEPNPRIPFDTTPFQPITELKPWPAPDGKRFAGISSFGVGGSNIHMILEGPPSALSSNTTDDPEDHKGPFIFPISAKNENCLSGLCSDLADFLQNNHFASPAAIMRTLCKGRRHFSVRTAMAGKTLSELIEKLQTPKITKTDAKPLKIGFMFTGQGSQYAGMGQELYHSSKIFRKAIDTVAEAMQKYLDHPLPDILFREKGEHLDDTKYAQPAIFAIEYGLYKYWLSLGAKPHAVTGHSIGEFAAACASGVMSLESAAFLICRRGALCSSLPSGGGMTAFFASRKKLENLIHTNALEGLDVAAINGPKHTVLAGPVELLNKAESMTEKHGILFRPLDVSHAFHSRQLNPIIDNFKQLVNSVELCTPDVNYISCLTGQKESETLSTCEYWADHLRSPVQFTKGARALLDSGCDLILEIGPNAILEGMARRFLSSDIPILTSMRKGVDSEVCIFETVSALYRQGAIINWDHLISEKVQMVSIPTYPFKKDIYWAPRSMDKDKSPNSSVGEITTHSQMEHPLELLREKHPAPTFKATIDIQRIPALQNHIINGTHMAPLGILATLMTDAWKMFKEENSLICLKNIRFNSPVLLSAATPAAVHILPEENGKISIFQNKEGKWIKCTSAEVSQVQPEVPSQDTAADAGTTFSPGMLPPSLKDLGKDSRGERLWRLENIRTSGNTVHADIILEKKLIEGGGGLAVNPSLIDPAIQLLGAFPELFKSSCVLAPIASQSISFRHSHGEKLHCLISLHENSTESVRCSISLQTHEKKNVLSIENLELIRIAEAADSALPDTEPKPKLTFLSWQQALPANRNEKHDNNIHSIILFHSALSHISQDSIDLHPVKIENIHEVNSDLFKKLNKFPNESELNLIYASDSSNIDDHVHFFNELAKYGKVRSLIVTASGALSIAGEKTRPIQRAVWELARVFAAENPQASVRCIDLNNWNAFEDGVLCLLDQPEATGQCAYRLGQLIVPVLRKINADEPIGKIRKNLLNVPETKTALVSGATGGLGRALIKKLVQNGCRSLLLTSRRQPSSIIEKEWNILREKGVQILFHAADISMNENVTELLQNCGDKIPELGAVYHLAGENSYAPLTELSPAEFQIRTAAKLKGAELLHELTAPMRPDIFVMFSSISALNGVPKAGAYSAANGYLEALAEMRRSQGLPSTCISWGPFKDSGMLKEDSDGHEQRKSLGIHALNTDNALELLKSIPQSIPVIHATANDWSLFYERMIALKNKPWFRLEEDSQKNNAESGTTHEKADSSLTDQTPYDAELESFISQSVSELLKSSEPPSAEDNLLMSGLDSLLFLQLAQKLRKKIGVKISPPEVFSNPTIKNICHLVRKKTESSIKDGPKSANTEKQAVQSFELTDTQYAYWAGRSSSLPLGNVSCHSYAEYNVKNLDRERYSASWNTLIKRHPMLRMIITSDGMQSILPEVPPLKIKHHDLRDLSDNVRGHRISEIRNELSHKVHDTSNWPLFSVQTIQIAADVTRICVSIDLLFADARSLQILMREIRDIYEASSDTQSPEQLCDQGFFNKLEYNFRQYIADHKQWEKSEEGQETLKAASNYWNTRLPELPHGPDLPLASTPEEISRPVFNQHLATIPKKKWRTIKEKAKAKNLTPSLLLMAVYADVLGRWSCSKDFCLNVTLFNRQPYHPQVNDIIGDFTNLSLLEIKHDPKRSFLERAMAIRDQFWKDMEYSSLSGVEVIRRLTRAGRLSFGESYPVVFTSNISGESGPRLLEAMGERGFNISQTPQVWLDNQVHEEQGNLIIHWDSVDKLFHESMIDDMLSAYVKILESLADNDSAWLQQSFDILPRRTLSLIESMNKTEADIPQHTLVSLFQEGCRHKPDAPAIITSKGLWTYKNIAGYAEAVARWLEEKEVETGYPVGVCLPKGALQIAAVLGVCATGAAFVPIDHELPELRREALLEEAGMEILLTEDIISSLPALSTDEELLKRSPSAPGELAYVVYTSGSTGKPKGVAISHEAAVNTILDVNRRYKISSNDRIFGVSRLSFDLSVYDIFGAFAAGAALILPDDESQRDPAHWLDCLSTHKCTVWNSAPALLQLAIEYAESNGQDLPSMKTVMLSGDKISPDLPPRMKKLSPKAEIHSLGGATEAAIWSICLPISNHKPSDGPIPYGRPMDNQQWYVLDGSLHPCPENVQGDLYIGGKGLAIGYYNDRTRTAKTFIRHPETGKRLYRTGDLGSMTGSGMLTIAGRRDFQVKVNGHRVEPSEIEHILSNHPDITSLSVAATHIEGNVRLVCHYVGSIKEEDLRGFASGRLPRYMIPSNFMRLDSFPVTPSGKIDRKALPIPSEEMDSTSGNEKDMTETEQAVAKIWNRLLQRESTHPETDFFSAGGDSVLAARMTLELGKSFKTEFALPRFFESPTIRGLAGHFQKRDTILSQEASIHSSCDSKESKNSSNLVDILHTSVLAKHHSANSIGSIIPSSFSKSNAPAPTEIKRPFLTGATGFVGSHLLASLLSRGMDKVFCLVRAQSEATGLQRLLEAASSYGMNLNDEVQRIEIILGDLTKKRFGLPQKDFNRLSEATDAIFHAGALVHYIYSYETLIPPNVQGVREAVRLACTGRAKHIHHISTVSVFSPIRAEPSLKVYEEEPIDQDMQVFGGYPQSKWIAEKVLNLAAEQGVGISIYRPGLVTGSSRTGGWNREDFLYRIVKGSIQAGCFPDLDRTENFLPVDVVADAIIHIALSNSEKRFFNIDGFNPVKASTLFQAMERYGAGLKLASYEEWRNRINVEGNALFALLPILPRRVDPEKISNQLVFDNTNSKTILKDSTVHFPNLEELLPLYLRTLMS